MSAPHSAGPLAPERTEGEMRMSSELAGARWFKSSRSGAGKECVEVAFLRSERVGVRDSKNPEGPALIFGTAAWTEFTAAVRRGRFDDR